MSSAAARRVPVTPLTQEVRLATTMTGGVSLAVWMGGVAREINLVAQASDYRQAASLPDAKMREIGSTTATDRLLGLYLRLLELLDAVVDVDVLSGTSAGGINAALLGFARVNHCDLGGLRELWLDLGSMLDLLRTPTDADLPSLMYGDRKMFADLVNELPRLPASIVTKEDLREVRPTTVYITTTLLSGETSRFTDSFGTLVHDLDHHGLFTFDEDTLVAHDDNIHALALAARSTASFPAAFEPSFLPVGAGLAETPGVPARPNMQDYGNVSVAHWAADGGLLDNQPIDVLIDRIFERPAERPVRRALLFVVPTSGPDAAVSTGDNPAASLGLVDALLKDIKAVTSQSITRDLNRIREHNERITTRVDARLRLAELAGRLREGSVLSSGLFSDYCRREAERVAGKLTPAILDKLAEMPAPPDAIASALAVGGNAEAVCRSAIAERLRSAWLAAAPSSSADRGGPATVDELTALDQPAFDVATAVALAFVRDAFQAAGKDDRAAVIAALNAVHKSRPDTQDDTASVQEVAVDPTVTLAGLAVRVADQWRRDHQVTSDNWADLGSAIRQLATVPDDGTTAPAGAHERSTAAIKAEAAQMLRTYRSYLKPDGPAEAVALRLFELAGAQRAMLPATADQEQPLELIQVSADTRSLLAPKHPTAGSKLTGLQFHHFGAFYKRSWRANDWMWGRVDGAGWLVHILLDPRRLQLVCEQTGPDSGRVSWLLGQLADIAGAVPDGATAVTLDNGVVIDDASLRAELAFLDDPAAAVATSLPLTALWVARAFQRVVLDDEIPQVVDAIGEGKQDTDWSPAATLTWARDIRSGVTAGDARLDSCPVPAETFSTEVGSRLMVRTVAKAAATAAGALACVKQVPAAGKPALTTMRTITLGGYRAVNATGARPRWMMAAGAALMVVGIIAAAQDSTVVGLGGVGLAAVGAYLIAFGAWQTSIRLLSALISITIVAAFGALATAWVRHRLFGTSAKDGGWVGKNVHWVGDAWWRPWVVVAAVLVAGAIVAVVIPWTVRTISQRLANRKAKQTSNAQAKSREAARSVAAAGAASPRQG